MRLYVLRHAEAVDRDAWHGDDADRPLTRDGARTATFVLKRTRELVRATAIWTSPWLRARSTAELAAGIWKLPLREVPWLAAGAASDADRIAALPDAQDLVLVGHEPDLGELVGLLIGARPLPLKKSGLAVLHGEPRPRCMELRALFAPKAVSALVGEKP